MTDPVREHPSAGSELLAAAEYYEGLVPGLGHEFMIRVAEAVRSIGAGPESWPPVADAGGGGVARRRSVRTFPYSVVYIHHRAEIVILAYVHDHQRPGYWRGRAAGSADG